MGKETVTYVYWTADCKTPNCDQGHIAKLIGPHDWRPIYVLPVESPEWFDFECGQCHKVHRYLREDLKARLVDHLPPPEFVPWF